MDSNFSKYAPIQNCAMCHRPMKFKSNKKCSNCGAPVHQFCYPIFSNNWQCDACKARQQSFAPQPQIAANDQTQSSLYHNAQVDFFSRLSLAENLYNIDSQAAEKIIETNLVDLYKED